MGLERRPARKERGIVQNRAVGMICFQPSKMMRARVRKGMSARVFEFGLMCADVREIQELNSLREYSACTNCLILNQKKQA